MDLSLNSFVLTVLLGSAMLVVLFAIISRTLHARAEAKSLANRIICRLCLHVFEDHSHADIVHCPRCNAANERGRSRKLG